MVSRQGLSNKTRSYKPMIKNYWTNPNLTPEQQKQYKQAAAIMRKAAGAEPNSGKTICIDIDEEDVV